MITERIRPLATPLAGEAGERPLLAAWILVILSFHVPLLPVVPLLGYVVRVLESGADGDATLPPFASDVAGLVAGGVAAAALCVAYLALPTVLLAATLEAVASAPSPPSGFGPAVALLGGVTAVLLVALAAAYCCSIALVRYARERRLRAALDLRAIAGLAVRVDVFVGWVTGVAGVGIGGALASALLAVPRIGPVLAALALAYAVLLASVWMGRGTGRVA